MAQVFDPAIGVEARTTACRHPEVIEPILARSLDAHGAREVARLFSVLADPSRARILHLLAISEGALCVCDMALVVGMSVSALSHQLRFLREVGAVERRKAGRVAWYRLVDDHLRDLVLGAATHVAERRGAPAESPAACRD